MSSLGHEGRASLFGAPRGRSGRSELAERGRFEVSSPALIAAGLVAVGLGLWAWYYFGPDVRRYMKMRAM